MGRCGATELRGVIAGTTSPAANRLAVRVTPATLMPVPVPATVAVPPVLVPVLLMGPVLVLVQVPVLMRVVVPGPGPVPVPILVMVPGLVTIRASVPVRGCRGEFRGMYRATGDRDERLAWSPRPPS
jgi:hypothetical protein